VDERVEIVEDTIWESFAADRASATATVLDTETIRLGMTGVPYAGLNGVRSDAGSISGQAAGCRKQRCGYGPRWGWTRLLPAST
jgi:hypothetical protein